MLVRTRHNRHNNFVMYVKDSSIFRSAVIFIVSQYKYLNLSYMVNYSLTPRGSSSNYCTTLLNRDCVNPAYGVLRFRHCANFCQWSLLPKNAAGIYLLKVNNKNTGTIVEIYSKLTIRTPERSHSHSSGVFIVNFEHISHLVLVFSLLTEPFTPVYNFTKTILHDHHHHLKFPLRL